MSERENLQAQAEAMKEAAKAHGGANRKRIDEGLRRYLATEALHMSRETEGTKKEHGASREK